MASPPRGQALRWNVTVLRTSAHVVARLRRVGSAAPSHHHQLSLDLEKSNLAGIVVQIVLYLLEILELLELFSEREPLASTVWTILNKI